MNRRTARAAGLVALLMGAGTLVQPVHAAAPAPQNTCSGAFCVTFDLITYDAFAPTQPTTAAAQPTNLALRFTDTSSAVATDKSTWLAKVSAVLGSTSSKAFAVTAPDQLPAGRVRRRHGGHREWLRRRHGLRRRLPGRLRDRTGRGAGPAPDRPPSRRRRSGSPASPPVPGVP